jgi:hypothetical protein
MASIDFLKRRLGTKHSKLKQQTRKIINPDFARDFVISKEKQKCAANLESFSGRGQTAELPSLNSYHLDELHYPVSIDQQVLCQIFYIGEGGKPSFIDILNCGMAPDIPADRAFYLPILRMTLRKHRHVMVLPGLISPGKKLHNFLGRHAPNPLL